MTSGSSILRRIPSLDQILRTKLFEELLATFPRNLVVDESRLALEQLRRLARLGQLDSESLEREVDRLAETVGRALCERLSPALRRVINATGVVLHTNVGRAPLSLAAARHMTELATGYSNLEFDLKQRCRGRRDVHLEKRLVRLLGCEAATVCNNNAAAVFLILNTFAEGRNVLVSRGQLVEIGGSFRIPAIMSKSGAILREVGTTNKTRVSDYRDALDEGTSLILQVHTSNYKIVGFTRQPTLQELVFLAREKGILLVKDAGSGLLFPSALPFLQSEPSIVEVLKEGVDLVCFSGDKLLGGPQCGIIAGARLLIDRIRKNPLMRVVRVDKITYAALEQTLIEVETGMAEAQIPVQRMLSFSQTGLKERSEAFLARLHSTTLRGRLRRGHSVVGGGAAPLAKIPTTLIGLRSSQFTATRLEERLRTYSTPILGRVVSDELVLDLRTVFPEEESTILACLNSLG